jgi:hypothetical protein
MDVFRFAKLPQRANDPTRRYRLVRGQEKDHVGDVEITGDAPDGDTVVLSMTCHPVLSDAAREDALGTAHRFVEELAAGWGRAVVEGPAQVRWEGQPDGRFRVRQAYRVG